MPLLWKVLANKYGDSVVFANVRDPRGLTSKALGFAPQEPEVRRTCNAVTRRLTLFGSAGREGEQGDCFQQR